MVCVLKFLLPHWWTTMIVKEWAHHLSSEFISSLFYFYNFFSIPPCHRRLSASFFAEFLREVNGPPLFTTSQQDFTVALFLCELLQLLRCCDLAGNMGHSQYKKTETKWVKEAGEWFKEGKQLKLHLRANRQFRVTNGSEKKTCEAKFSIIFSMGFCKEEFSFSVPFFLRYLITKFLVCVLQVHHLVSGFV